MKKTVLSTETGITSQWLDQNERLYRYSRNLAQNAETTSKLAQTLKYFFEEKAPEEHKAGIFGDLLNCALAKVNWEEIAENLMEEFREKK